jgi:hypothetical protein
LQGTPTQQEREQDERRELMLGNTRVTELTTKNGTVLFYFKFSINSFFNSESTVHKLYQNTPLLDDGRERQKNVVNKTSYWKTAACRRS